MELQAGSSLDRPSSKMPLKVTVGYGYRPLWAFWEVLVFSALGWIVYRRSYLAGSMVPTDKDANQSFKSDGQSPTTTVRLCRWSTR